MERERAEEGCVLGEEGAGERFYHKANDGAQAEAVAGIGPMVLHHLSKAAGHELDIVHFIQIPHDIELYTAAEGFNKVAGKAGAAAPQLVDDAYTGLYAGGDALPLDSMVEETIAIVKRHIEGALGFAALSGK